MGEMNRRAPTIDFRLKVKEAPLKNKKILGMYPGTR